jgi:hypothetical protein
MKKAKIKIEKIFRNVVQTKNGPANKFTLMYKNYGFTGWGKGSEYKEGDIVEIEYDETSKYQTGKYTYFNLIRKQENTKEILKEILEIVKRIEKKMDDDYVIQPPAETPAEEFEQLEEPPIDDLVPSDDGVDGITYDDLFGEEEK